MIDETKTTTNKIEDLNDNTHLKSLLNQVMKGSQEKLKTEPTT